MAKAEKRRRKKRLRRERIEAEIRQYRGRRRRRLAINLGVLVLVMAVIFGLVANAQRSRERAGEETAADEQCDHTEPLRGEAMEFPEPPPMTIDPEKTYTAVIETSCGTITLELAADVSPQTVNSFVFLARQGFYDGLSFHRISQNYVVQGGDPRGDGTGGPGYQLVEPPPPLFEYGKGTVAMAKGLDDPAGTLGSQFFIVSGAQGADLSGTEETPAAYAVLGRVVDGIEAVDLLNEVETFTPADAFEKSTPRQPVFILSITIQES